MALNTKIEWCDASWDAWRGCTEVSPGCANCYARELSYRNPAIFGSWGKGKPRVKSKGWHQPILWDRKAAQAGEPLWVFPSKCDWLDEEVPAEWLGQFLDLISATPHLRWLLLSKRPGAWIDRMIEAGRWAHEEGKVGAGSVGDMIEGWIQGRPPANVWVGTSVEDQTRTSRLPQVLAIPAALRFLSVEPLLGPVDLSEWLEIDTRVDPGPHGEGVETDIGQQINWVIVGGESGRLARPCNVEWVQAVIRQCKQAEVPVFVKQLGANAVCDREPARPWRGLTCLSNTLRHPKGGDPSEWPADLRVRQFPEERL